MIFPSSEEYQYLPELTLDEYNVPDLNLCWFVPSSTRLETVNPSGFVTMLYCQVEPL